MKKILIFGEHSYIGTALETWFLNNPKAYAVTVCSSHKDCTQADFSGQDAVICVAGIAHVDTGKGKRFRKNVSAMQQEKMERYMEVNCRLAVRIAELARAAGVRQFIFMSSSAVYGEAQIGRGSRIGKDTPTGAVGAYAKSKLEAERQLFLLQNDSFYVAAVRSPIVYGTGCKGNYPLLSGIACRLPFFPQCRNERSMIFVDNLCAFLACLVEKEKSGIFWPQDAEYVNTTELAKEIAQVHGKKLRVIPGSLWITEALSHVSPRARKAFGSLAYEKTLSEIGCEYQKVDRREAIRKSERKEISAAEASGMEEHAAEKVLFVSSVASMLLQFNKRNIRILQKAGYRVDLACNFREGNTVSEEVVQEFRTEMEKSGVRCFQMNFKRGTGEGKANAEVYRALKQLMKKEQYAFVHCHSPIGGVLGRLAAFRTGTKVIDTAHGFQFQKGGPRKDWIFFYPVEWLLSWRTDVLITLNREDTELATRHLHAKRTCYIPGIGLDIEDWQKRMTDKKRSREKLGIAEDDFLIVSAGELCKRKDHETLIWAISEIPDRKIHCRILGQGALKAYLETRIRVLQLEDRIKLEGFVKDPALWYSAADVAVLPSRREGLAVAGLEAEACGLALIATGIRGITDYLEDGKNGLLFEPGDSRQLAEEIKLLKDNPELRCRMGEENRRRILDFSSEKTDALMEEIYESFRENKAAVLP